MRESETHTPVDFVQVHDQTLRQQALVQIRRAILCGQLAVGQRLMEADLAAQMGVSRVPVREAFRQLEHEGLLESTPHRGTVVAAVDEEEVELLYRLRAELEAFAVEAVLNRPGAAAIVATLQQHVEAMRAGVRARDRAEIAQRDLAFHRAIVAGSGYRTLLRVWQSMDGPVRARMQRALDGPFQQDLIGYTAESHQPVVDAMVSGEPARAAAAVRQHILETRQLLEAGVEAGVRR